MALLSQKVGVGRARANLRDTEYLCPVCDEFIDFGQRIVFIHSGLPVHKYRCLNFYYMALYIYYGLDVGQLIWKLGIEVRKAYRIQKLARKFLAGELEDVPGRHGSN